MVGGRRNQSAREDVAHAQVFYPCADDRYWSNILIIFMCRWEDRVLFQHHRQKLAELHHRHKHNHPTTLVLVLLFLGFYALNHEQENLPEGVSEKVEAVGEHAEEIAETAKTKVIESDEFQQAKEKTAELKEKSVTSVMALIFQPIKHVLISSRNMKT